MQLPPLKQVLFNAGMAMQNMGRPDLSLRFFEEAIAEDSTFR